MHRDFSTLTGRLAILEEATAEWSPRARKCARNTVTDSFLLLSPQDSNKTLEMLLEALVEYQENGTPLLSRLEARFERLSKKPRRKVAQSLFYGPYNEPVNGHRKIWSQYTTLAGRFQHDVNMVLGGFQVIAIWRYLGVPVHEESLEMLFSDHGTKANYANIQGLAKESSKQVWIECEKALEDKRDIMQIGPMTGYVLEKMADIIASILNGLTEKEIIGVSLFLGTLGYSDWESANPTVMVEALKDNPVIEAALESGDFELVEKLERIGSAHYLTELHMPGLVEMNIAQQRA